MTSPARRQRLSRVIAAAVAAARGPSAGSIDLRVGGVSGEVGAVLNAALQMAYESAVLGFARTVVAESA
jgi:hypothetical protein